MTFILMAIGYLIFPIAGILSIGAAGWLIASVIDWVVDYFERKEWE